MEFDEWLRTELAHRGWTLTEFGRRIGVSVAAVSRWAKGQRRPDVESIPRIAAELGLSPEVVFNMAGYRMPERTPVEGLRQQIVALRAERDTLQHQSQHLAQRVDQLDQRIVEVERLEQAMAQGMLFKRPVAQEERVALPDPFAYLEPLCLHSAQFERELNVIERQYRQEWSILERAAFARGVELGIRAASLLGTTASVWNQQFVPSQDVGDWPQEFALIVRGTGFGAREPTVWIESPPTTLLPFGAVAAPRPKRRPRETTE